MSRKLFGFGLLLVVFFGLSMASRVSSQDNVDKSKADSVKPDSRPNLDQMVQELKNVRAQKEELEKREQQLMGFIEKAITEERQRLDQRYQERRRRLDDMEGLIHRGATGRASKAVEKFHTK